MTLLKAKQLNNTKIDVRNKQVKNNGDIVIDDFKFPKALWSKLIGNIIDSFNSILCDIFVGDNWKLVVDRANQLSVHRVEDDSSPREDLLHHNFSCNKNGKVVKHSQLAFLKEIQPSTFEHLTALVMISLHGLGEYHVFFFFYNLNTCLFYILIKYF